MNCKNCGTSITSNFCPECGQKAKVDRITFAYLMKSIVSSVFQVEHGFLFTIKELIIRPTSSIKDFISGKRVNFYKPFAYVIIMSTIASFAVYLIDSYIRSKYNIVSIQIDENSPEYYWDLSTAIFSKYQSLFYFLMVPVISLFSWMFFTKKFNYWENIVLNTYLTAQFNILLIIVQVSRLFVDGNISYTPYLIVFFTYIAFVYSGFFSAQKKRLIHSIKMIVLILLIVLLYTTGMSFAGMMTPWWN